MKILNFGSCNIDKVYSVDHITACGETNNASTMELFPGGKGLNQSVALAKTANNVYHAGCIGDDGKFLKELLSDNNVNTTYLNVIDEVTGHAIIQLDKNAENCIIIFGGANRAIGTDYIDNVLDNFEEGDFIVLQNEISNVGYIIDKAYEKGMKIVLNPSPVNDDILNIDLSKVTYILLNETEGKAYKNSENPEEILDYMAQNFPELHVVLTLGKRGSVYSYKSERYYQDSFTVAAVDTTGAGDTFSGFFIANICDGMSPDKAMKIASAASALAVSKKGASSSIPTKAEVMEFLSDK